MYEYIWLLVPVDPCDLYTARDAEAFTNKEKAIATGLSCIESYGKYEGWSEDFIKANKAQFIEHEECDCLYLVSVPLHYA